MRRLASEMELWRMPRYAERLRLRLHAADLADAGVGASNSCRSIVASFRQTAFDFVKELPGAKDTLERTKGRQYREAAARAADT